MSAPASRPPVLGLILGGGQATRMGGGDKCLLPLAGRPILAHILERLAPQVDRVVLNANGDAARFAAFGLPVAGDVIEGFPGPLAGVLTGLEWARDHAPGLQWIATVPGDGPFLPLDLVARFLTAVEAGAELVAASSGGNSNPVIGLWPVALAGDLRRALVEEGLRKVDRWTARYRLATVDWPAEPTDPFFNANTREDLAEAERLLALG